MDWELLNYLMGKVMKAVLKRVIRMDKGRIILKMEIFIQENGLKEKEMVKESLHGRIKNVRTQEIGKMIKCMDMELLQINNKENLKLK